jgi:hypothetical protein
MQGCKMVKYCQTKNPTLGKFWLALERKGKDLYIIWLFGIYYSHLVYFMAILVKFASFWYI